MRANENKCIRLSLSRTMAAIILNSQFISVHSKHLFLSMNSFFLLLYVEHLLISQGNKHWFMFQLFYFRFYCLKAFPYFSQL